MTADDDWYALIRGRNGERLTGWHAIYDFPALPARRLKWIKVNPDKWLALLRAHHLSDEQIRWCLAHPVEVTIKAREARRVHAEYRRRQQQARRDSASTSEGEQ